MAELELDPEDSSPLFSEAEARALFALPDTNEITDMTPEGGPEHPDGLLSEREILDADKLAEQAHNLRVEELRSELNAIPADRPLARAAKQDEIDAWIYWRKRDEEIARAEQAAAALREIEAENKARPAPPGPDFSKWPEPLVPVPEIPDYSEQMKANLAAGREWLKAAKEHRGDHHR